MSTEKENAVLEYAADRKKEAFRDFQQRVNNILNEISALSHRLKAAKKCFSELEYEEPEKLDLE